MSDWTMLTKQQLENDAEDRAGDSSAMDHILTGLALYSRIAELEAENLRLRDEVGDEWARAEQAKAENKRLLDRITQLRQYRDQMLELTHRAEQAEAELAKMKAR